MTALQKPEPLDQSVYHSREEYSAWQASMLAYHDAVRAEEARQREAQEQEENPPPRYLGNSEYDRIRRKQWEEDQARQKQRDDEQAAKEKARAEYLASSPDVAEILAFDSFTLLTEVIHWASKGYSLPEDGIQYFTQGCFTVRMTKPANTRKPKQS